MQKKTGNKFLDIKDIRIGIVGATGAVGEVALEILESNSHPIENIIAMASPRSEGKKINYSNKYLTVKSFHKDMLDFLDVLIVSATSEVSMELSIVAKKIGFSPVDAIENDEICRSDFFHNLSLNHMNEKININFRDALQLDNYSYDVILANIEKNIIMDLIPMIKNKGTKLILSGILEEQANDVKEQLVSEGFKNIIVNNRKEWICVVADYI